MASAGFDCQLLIWDLEEETVALEMESLPQPVRLNNTYLQYKTTHTLYGNHKPLLYLLSCLHQCQQQLTILC